MDYLESLSDDKLQQLIDQHFEHEIKRTRRSFLQSKARLLGEKRARRAEFEDRLVQRYRDVFDLYELLLIQCRDAGAAYNRDTWAQAEANEDIAFEALRRIHTRACVVGSEVRVLLLSGFASGALARWRTLHEMAITALFIQKHGVEAARRYMAHDSIRTLKELEKWSEIQPVTDPELLDDIEALRQGKVGLVKEYGKVLPRISVGRQHSLTKSRHSLKLRSR